MRKATLSYSDPGSVLKTEHMLLDVKYFIQFSLWCMDANHEILCSTIITSPFQGLPFASSVSLDRRSENVSGYSFLTQSRTVPSDVTQFRQCLSGVYWSIIYHPRG